jgi:hypothetical protein
MLHFKVEMERFPPHLLAVVVAVARVTMATAPMVLLVALPSVPAEVESGLSILADVVVLAGAQAMGLVVLR